MKRALLALTVTLALPACSLFDNSDPREGTEPVEECIARFADLKRALGEDTSNAQSQPTYTFDVTKLAFDDLQELVAQGADDTLGQRLMRQTNEDSTAVSLFMNENVDENGALFLGRDPALYRVRGPLMWPRDAVDKGCEMQRAGMRLRDVESIKDFIVEPAIAPEPDIETSDNETTN